MFLDVLERVGDTLFRKTEIFDFCRVGNFWRPDYEAKANFAVQKPEFGGKSVDRPW